MKETEGRRCNAGKEMKDGKDIRKEGRKEDEGR